jgi:hypothetical protein
MDNTAERSRKGKSTPPARWSEGEARKALRELKDALELAEITLPSLDIDHLPGSSLGGGPLIELGRVRPDVVEELAEVIRRGLARE